VWAHVGACHSCKRRGRASHSQAKKRHVPHVRTCAAARVTGTCDVWRLVPRHRPPWHAGAVPTRYMCRAHVTAVVCYSKSTPQNHRLYLKSISHVCRDTSLFSSDVCRRVPYVPPRKSPGTRPHRLVVLASNYTPNVLSNGKTQRLSELDKSLSPPALHCTALHRTPAHACALRGSQRAIRTAVVVRPVGSTAFALPVRGRRVPTVFHLRCECGMRDH
jgi:hypothetical protein